MGSSVFVGVSNFIGSHYETRYLWVLLEGPHLGGVCSNHVDLPDQLKLGHWRPLPQFYDELSFSQAPSWICICIHAKSCFPIWEAKYACTFSLKLSGRSSSISAIWGKRWGLPEIRPLSTFWSLCLALKPFRCVQVRHLACWWVTMSEYWCSKSSGSLLICHLGPIY